MGIADRRGPLSKDGFICEKISAADENSLAGELSERSAGVLKITVTRRTTDHVPKDSPFTEYWHITASSASTDRHTEIVEKLKHTAGVPAERVIAQQWYWGKRKKGASGADIWSTSLSKLRKNPTPLGPVPVISALGLIHPTGEDIVHAIAGSSFDPNQDRALFRLGDFEITRFDDGGDHLESTRGHFLKQDKAVCLLALTPSTRKVEYWLVKEKASSSAVADILQNPMRFNEPGQFPVFGGNDVGTWGELYLYITSETKKPRGLRDRSVVDRVKGEGGEGALRVAQELEGLDVSIVGATAPALVLALLEAGLLAPKPGDSESSSAVSAVAAQDSERNPGGIDLQSLEPTTASGSVPVNIDPQTLNLFKHKLKGLTFSIVSIDRIEDIDNTLNIQKAAENESVNFSATAFSLGR
jgi:hypothetical protein